MQPIQVSGWLLIVGGLLAVIGAFWPPYRQWSAPLEEALRIIASHPIGWRCIHAGFVGGTVVSALGLAMLAYALRGAAGGSAARVSAVLFAVAAGLWLVNIAYRLSVMPWAANELVATGIVPATYAPWRSFAKLLFAGFSALGYLAVAASGWSALQASLTSPWVGWLLVVWGLSGGFVFGANVPFIMYVAFIVLGGHLVQT